VEFEGEHGPVSAGKSEAILDKLEDTDSAPRKPQARETDRWPKSVGTVPIDTNGKCPDNTEPNEARRTPGDFCAVRIILKNHAAAAS
jgi:hypothetical protein